MDLYSRWLCAQEAVRAWGDTERTNSWYQWWMPDKWHQHHVWHYRTCRGCLLRGKGPEHHYPGLPTTVQYSLSCFLMDDAAALVGAPVRMVK